MLQALFEHGGKPELKRALLKVEDERDTLKEENERLRKHIATSGDFLAAINTAQNAAKGE